MTGDGGGPRPLRLLVTLVQALAVAGAALFVVMLFVNEPSGPVSAVPAAPADGDGDGEADGDDGEADDGDAAAVDGAAVYSARCASCHGATGGGGSGPPLDGGRVVEAYPDVADQIALVTDGQRGMPSFGGRLPAEEIEAVVEYTRSL